MDCLKKKLKLAVGSSSKNTQLILEKTDMKKYFDAIADGNDIRNSKPDPEVFLLAADRIQLTPEECLVVEDAKAGVEAAIRGGFDCAGIGDAAQDKRVTIALKSFDDLQQLA